MFFRVIGPDFAHGVVQGEPAGVVVDAERGLLGEFMDVFVYVSSVFFVRVISMCFMESSFLGVFAHGSDAALVTVKTQNHIIHHVHSTFIEVF